MRIINPMTYTIAEIGNNHNGSIEKFLTLIASAAEAGADAIKTQSFRGLDIVAPNVLSSEYPEWDSGGYKYWYEFADSIALPLDDHQTAIDYTHSLNLDFITTPVSAEIVNILEEKNGIDYYKVASMDLNNLELLAALSKTNKPIILSTGMGTINEIKKAVNILNKKDLTLLHCISDYPLEPKNANLNNLRLLSEEFKQYKIGFSDHSLGHEIAFASVFFGAQVIEKHFTMSRKDKNPAEHHFSMEPSEFKEMIKWLRVGENNNKKTEWSRSENELENGKIVSRRSFHYRSNLSKGHNISKNDLLFIRPGNGIDYSDIDKVIGKQLSKDVAEYDCCSLNDFD